MVARRLVITWNALVGIVNVAERFVGQFLWPQGSKRHTVVYAAINFRKTISTGAYYLRAHGVSGFLALVSDRWRHGNVGADPLSRMVSIEPIQQLGALYLPQTEDFSAFEIESDRAVEKSPSGISVVIPVLNGSRDLLKLLPTLHAQKGFLQIEVIIVDSGSTDDTVRIATELGAKVIEIPPKEFSHSHSRNVGAQNATQDFLLFMTVDALPPSDIWLYELYTFQQSNQLAAVSCMEIPKCDADLFSRVENWYHYRALLELDGSDRILSMPRSADPASLRKSAQISNVSCLIPRELFLRYGFRHEYAEDLDLGVRLIRDGQRLGLLRSTKVIHSHTRPAFYCLKRGYIDKLVLSQILNEPYEEPTVEFRSFMLDVFFTLNVLQRVSAELDRTIEYTVRFDEFRRAIKEKYVVPSPASHPKRLSIHRGQFLDGDAISFLTQLYDSYYHPSAQQYQRILIPGIEAFHDIAFQYMGITFDILDKTICDDFQSLTYNYFTNLIGRWLAVYYLKREAENEGALFAIDAALRGSP